MKDLQKLAQMALDALLYHVEMTRPIQKTSDAIVELRAAIATPHAPTAQGDVEFGWLIEMKFGGGLLYWGGGFDPAVDDFQHARLIARMVKDAGHAVRFARREDGQRVLDAMLSARPCPILPNARGLYSVQEHMWLASAQPAQKVEKL